MGQLLVEGGEPERNLERAVELILEAKLKNCTLVLLPECLDLAWTHPSCLVKAQPIPGAYSNILSDQARINSIYICAGLTEADGNKIYNSAILINPDGEIILKYRKINVLEVALQFYEIGQSLAVVDTPFGKMGLNICSDNYTNGLHIGHTLARMGAQIILSPSSWTVDHLVSEIDDPYKEKWLKPYATLTGLYNIALVGTTSVGYIVGGPYEGKKMVGCSLAVQNGQIIGQGSFNEFTSELIPVEVSITERMEKGTAIGEMLLRKGYQFD